MFGGSAEESSGGISYFEAEQLIERLTPFPIGQVGSEKWMKQHQVLERLNIQSHINAQNQNEEFITDLFVTHGKIEFLVQDLLIIETWKHKVFPHLMPQLSANSSMKTYFVLYHEASVVNLLEILFFAKSAVFACNDLLIDLVDYCYRKMLYLNSVPPPVEAPLYSLDPKEILSKEVDDIGNLKASMLDMDFKIAFIAVALFRYITDQISDCSISVTTKILLTHDMISTSVHLMEKAPWLRKTAAISTGNSKSPAKIERYEDGRWVVISREDLPKLCKMEAQVWLILYNLLIDPECRRKYAYTSYNQSVILRIREFILPETMDQLPILTDLLRYLEELSMMTFSDDPVASRSGGFIEELSDNNSPASMTTQECKDLAKAQVSSYFNDSEASRRETAKSLAAMYNLDDLDALLEVPKCAQCGAPAMQRCSRCKNEWYCARVCQVKGWKSHKSICDVIYKSENLRIVEQA